MAPTLAFSDYQSSGRLVADAAILTSASFTPSNGDVLVIKAQTWDTSVTPGTPTGGAQTYTLRVDNAPGSFHPRSVITTAVVAGSPGSMTVALSAPSATCHHDLTVEVWTSASLAATPATGSAAAGTGSAAGAVVTVGTGSIVSWCAADENSVDPATRAYLSSATEIGVSDGHANTNSVFYSAYQAAASAGSQTIGLSAPSGQNWTIAGIEIQTAGGGGAGSTGVTGPRVFPSLAATQRASW